jgi:hypothetical protein
VICCYFFEINEAFMLKSRFVRLVIALVVLAVVVLPLAAFLPALFRPQEDPWANVPNRLPHTDHSKLDGRAFESGSDVTRACLECHDEAGQQMIHTVHWKWESEPVCWKGRDEPVTVGKKNQINNFCIGIQSNWPPCTACHAGYGWVDENFDFSNEENVDCLVCHDTTGTYAKANGGNPAEGVDLLAVAQGWATPTVKPAAAATLRAVAVVTR